MPTTTITSASWDSIHNVSGFGDSDPRDAPLTLPTTDVSPGGSPASLHYYVRFTPFNGQQITIDSNELFGLDGFSFSDDQTVLIGSQSGGAGVGKVTFNPLHLSFEQPGLDPVLFQML